MNKNVRGLSWLVGGLVAVSMLGACGTPADDETAPEHLDLQSSDEVAVSLSVAKYNLGAHEDVAVTVTLTNVSTKPVRLLKWYIPGEGLKEGLFELSRDGNPVEYIGPNIMRVASRPEDFVVLAPGKNLSGLAPVSGLYDLSKTGSYTIRYSVSSLGQHGLLLTKAAQLNSNSVNLWIEGRDAARPERQSLGTGIGASFIPCNQSQRAAIGIALGSATSYAQSASAYLNRISSGTPRYTTWFGAFSTSRLKTLRQRFTNLKNSLAQTQPDTTFDCGTCTDESAYVYEYPNSLRTYLCRGFWTAPNTGTRSRAGILIHVATHSTMVAGTHDWVHGHSAAKNLAKSNPSKALDNADNYEFFAENNPALQ